MPLPFLLAALSHPNTLKAQTPPPAVRHYHRSLRSETPWRREGTLYFLVSRSGSRTPTPVTVPAPLTVPAPVNSSSPPDPTSAREDTHEQEERALMTDINAERVQRGLEPLTADPLLSETARAHSCEMCGLDYFDHLSPTAAEATPMLRYQRTLRDWGAGEPRAAMVGENIFYCSVTSDTYNVSYAHQSLMNSPGHRANILDPRFTKVGAGVYRDSLGRFWVTEMFLRD